jgi:outer membrane protein TolC
MLTPVPPATRDIANLEEALSLVKSRSTDLRIAYLEIDRAAAQTRIALAALLPTLTGNVTATQNILRQTSSSPGFVPIPLGSIPGLPLPPSIPPDTVVAGGSPSNATSSTQPVANLATGNLVLNQPLVHLADLHAWNTAKEAEKVARLSLEDLERNIALNVANTLVGVVTAERVAELNRIGFRNALERLDLTRRKQRLGAATGLDVVRAQQDVESARATLVTGDESLRQAREALGLALGLPQQIGVSRSLDINGLEQAALHACKPAELEDRADIQAQKQTLHVARRAHDNVWLQFAPTLDARSTLATTTASTAPLPPTTWNIQAILTVPLWEGGVRYGKLRDTDAQAEEAGQRLEALRRTATVQVAQALRNVKVAEDARKVAADARQLAAETDRLVRTGYMEGQGTSLELVVAAAALREAEVQLALKEFNLVQARVLAVLSLAKCPF